ncbi:MAG: hypothetical protein JOZ96_12195 [Acidobacteria bacterium]|nr:hypothetical protein [Acidobacteriota bacterium]
MNLEPVSRALAAHHAYGAAAAQLAREADRRIVKRLTTGLLTGVFVILFGVLLMAFLPGKGFQTLGLVAAILGLMFTLASVTSALRRMGDAAAGPLPPALDHTAPDTARLLHEQTFDSATTSIADHTTELLNVEAKGGKPRQGD